MSNGIALVTGANGFVGSHLCENLQTGGYRVRALVRKTSNLRFIEKAGYELAYGDISQPETLPAAVAGVDLVFHPAGVVRAPDRDTFFRINQLGTKNLVETVCKANPGLKRFVLISSQAAAGPSPALHPLKENDSPHPVSFYGESKLASEQELLAVKGKIPIVIIRPSAVYGPRDIDILKFFKLARWGLNPRLGCCLQYISLVHVSDLVRCVRLAAENPRAVGETFFACNPEYHSITGLMQIISKCIEVPVVDIALPRFVGEILTGGIEIFYKAIGKIPPLSRDKLKELSQRYWLCSADKASQLLGWSAVVEIEEGLRQTWDWYREKGWL